MEKLPFEYRLTGVIFVFMEEDFTVNLKFADNGVRFEELMERIVSMLLEKQEGDDVL